MVSSGDGSAPPVEDLVDVYDDGDGDVNHYTMPTGSVVPAAAALVALAAVGAAVAGETVLGVGLGALALLGAALATDVFSRGQ